MKLITWNIQWGLGADGVHDLTRIVSEARRIADFDVLCLQEVADNMPDLKQSTGENQFGIFASLLPDYQPIEVVAVDVPDAEGKRRRFGNMVLSRLPVGQAMRHVLPWEADASVPSMPRALIDVVVTTTFGPVRVMTTHLEFSAAKLRAAQVVGIREVHRLACERAAAPPKDYWGPFIPQPATRSAVLCGDFNMRNDDPIKAHLQAPIGGDAPAFVDAWLVAKGGAPHPHSFCIVDQSFAGPHCCDFIFVTEDLVPRIRRIEYETETRASDHQPVLIELG